MGLKRGKRNIIPCFLLFALICTSALSGCASKENPNQTNDIATEVSKPPEEPQSPQGIVVKNARKENASPKHRTSVSKPKINDEREEPATSSETQEISEIDDAVIQEVSDNHASRLIVIDAGHQSVPDLSEEPLGPGSTEMKAKVAGGTSGITSGIPEYILTLDLAIKLKAEMESRGYEVLMTRESNDVNISNSDRAKIANDAGAGAFIRIHANGSDDPMAAGAMTICQTAQNPYNGDIYASSRALSESVLDGLVASTGCIREKVWETDTMSGINWASVPVTIVEVGYMTNPIEDALLATDEYKTKIIKGIADGIENYFKGQSNVF